MKQKPRRYITGSEMAGIWDRWEKGDSINEIARDLRRYHSSVQGAMARTGGIRPAPRRRSCIAFGEIIGTVTVVVTLFFLSLQIRQNTKAQSISTFERAMSEFNEVIRYSFGDTEQASVFRRGTTDPDSLDEDENILFNSMIRHYTNHIYKLFRLYERGVFPESEWINAVTETKQLFENNGLTRFRA